MIKPAIRQVQVGIRAYSSQAKATSFANTLITKSTDVAKCGLYYTKVFGELAKYVWIKEGLSPPTAAEIQKTFTTDLKQYLECALKTTRNPSLFTERAKGWNTNDYIRFGAAGVQLLGIFALGEIIGRRHIYGYKDYKHEH